MTNAQFLDAVAVGQSHPRAGGANRGRGRLRRGRESRAVCCAALRGVHARPSRSCWSAAQTVRRPDVATTRTRTRVPRGRRRRPPSARSSDVAIPLALALSEPWQYAILAAAVVALFPLRRPVVITLIGAGIIGAIAVQLGAAIS